MDAPQDTPNPQSGWYPDPSQPGQQRYWDGAQWTEHTAPGTGAAGLPAGVGGGVAGSDSTRRTWALAAHLSCFVGALVALAFTGPLVVWLLQKDQDPWVAAQAKEALNFHISLLIYLAISFVLTFVFIGVFGFVLVGLAFVIFPIVAAVKASNGESYRYPATIRFVS